MGKQLALAEQIQIAGELAYRCDVFHTTWFAIASRESRDKYKEALNEHAEILVMCQAAHLFALVCALHSLFERREDTVNLPALSSKINDVAADELKRCEIVAGKVGKLRHNLFAHRSGKLTTEKAYALAGITSNDLRWLSARAAAIVRMFARELDLPAPLEAIGAKVAVTKLLDAIARDTNATWAGTADPIA